MHRRRWIQTVGGGIAIGASGCLGSSDNGNSGNQDGLPDGDVEFIIPTPAGGSTDGSSRLCAEYWPQHLPGEPEIVPRNVEGANQRRGAEELSRADPDGLTVGSISLPGLVAYELATDTNYSVSDMNVIGGIMQGPGMVYTRPDTDYETYEDLQEAGEIPIAIAGSSTLMQMLIITTELDIDASTVMRGTTGETVSTVLSGEVDVGWNASDGGLSDPIEQGEIEPIHYWGNDRHPLDDNIPNTEDIGREDLGEIVFASSAALPPETPEDVLEVWRSSYDDLRNDDEFLNAFGDAGFRRYNRTYEEIEEGIESQYNLIEDHVDTLEPALD